ncbi:hypothetical protein N0B51_06875 [Tsuneonella sp. YG55]|uniref:Uncharacterized protein n=1 Tax=Tsuneonella litorea TaxID=2976475 RepID=A0A9X2W1S8_9SPHN|nr:hypothetical protein [Tsuneonella litorea]MCT2558699.1 hypothetical protein [Tsuneonella litorea]
MRVALLATTQDGADPVRLGGRPVAWHQLQAALALGCERVVCLAETPGPELAALQRETEGRGAKFSAIAHSRTLSGLVSAADNLFVFAPGVLPDRDWLAQALGARAGIAVLPADGAVERGFERIDRERAWGGVLATRGDSVEALAFLPPDADPVAGLLRVALQRGGRCVEVPQHWLDEGRWALLGDGAAAQRMERNWQARHVPAPGVERPGETLAHGLARVLLTRAANRPALAPGLAIGGIALALAGGAAGYLGSTVGGLVALAIGAFVAETGGRMGRFARAGSGVAAKGRMAEVRDGALDLALIAVAASPQEFADWHAPFVALVLVAATRLLRECDGPRALRLLGDRILVIAGLAVAAVFGAFVPAMAATGLAALGGRLFSGARRS